MSRRADAQMSGASAAAARNARQQGRKAGQDYSGAFGREVTKDLERAFKAIPEPDPGTKLGKWDKALGKLRTQMQELSKEKIGFTIDEKTAFKAIENMRKEARRLQESAKTSRGFFDAREVTGSLDGVIGKIDDAKARGRQSGDEYGGAFTDSLNRALTRGMSSIRPVKVTADTDEAERDLADLRSDIASLSGKTVGVDVNATEAMAELRRIEEKLRALDREGVDVRVRVEAREAAAGMKEFRNNTDNSSDSLARMDRAASLTMSRLQYLIAIGASIGSVIVPSAAAAAGAIGLIGTATIAGGAGLGVFALGISGISDAVKALNTYSNDQEKSQNSINQAQRSGIGTTDSLRQSQLALANTRRSIRQGEEDATRSVQDAVEDLARVRRDEGVAAREAARAVSDAQRDVTRSEVDAADARRTLNEAIRQAREDLDDLTTTLERNSQDQQKATTEQMAALNELNALKANPRATEVELRRAQDAYNEQSVRLDELRDKRKEINAEQEKQARLGIEGDSKVIAARDRVANADQRVADAKERRDRAQEAADEKAVKSAERIADSRKRITDAERARSRQAEQAQYQLASAQAAVAASSRQQQAALEKMGVAGGESLDKLNESMAGLTPTGRKFAKFIFGLKDDALALRAAASDPLLPGLQTAIEMLLPYLPGVSRFIGKIAAELGQMAIKAVEALGNPVWTKFFNYIDQSAVPALDMMFQTGMNVAQGLVSLYLALTPFDGQVGRGLVEMSEDFAMWAERLDKSKGYKEFLEYVRENGPRVLDFLGDLGTLAVHLVEALAPMGGLILESLDLFVDTLNAIPMPVLTILVSLLGAVALGITAIGTALRVSKFRREIGEVFGPTQQRYLHNYADATGRNVDQMNRYRRTIGTVGGAAYTARGHITNMGTAIATTFSPRYRALLDRYAAATGGAAGQTSRLRGALNLASGTARAAASRFSAAGGAMGTLRAGAGGLVSLLGGPWGVALTAATVALGYFTTKSQEQKGRVDTLKASLQLLNEKYVELSRKGTVAGDDAEAAFRQIVSSNPELQQAVVELDRLGISFDEMVRAAASGDPSSVVKALNDEMKVLNEQLDRDVSRSAAEAALGEKDRKRITDRIAQLQNVRDAYKENAKAIGLSADAARIMNEQTDRSIAMAKIQANNHGATTTQLAAMATQWDRNQAGLAALNTTLSNFGNNADAARRRANDLTAAIERQYGAAINANEATENWSGKLIDLREQVKQNSPTLDINTRAGLSNRDALQAAAQASREMFVEEVAAGGKLPEVTAKHNDRIKSLREEARKSLGANKEAQDLITTYGEIDPSITTKYTTEGFEKVFLEAQKLKFAQFLLEQGITDQQEADRLWESQQNSNRQYNHVGGGADAAAAGARAGAAQRKAVGGPIVGTGTGISDTELVLASPGEHVVTKEEVVAAGGHEQIHAWRRAILAGARLARHANGGPIMKSGVPALAKGGAVVPMVVNWMGTKLPSMAEAEDIIRRKQVAALDPFGMAGGGGSQAAAGWSAEQVANAMAIVRAGKAMKLPSRAWVIALATAMQESTLHNFGNLGSRNDHDSLGLFQQRPSMGWGTPEQVRNPDYAARSFYRRLIEIKKWQSMPLTRAAQRVQRSAYPDAYAKWEDDAMRLLQAITSGAASGGGGGGLLGDAVGGSGWRWQIGALRKQFPGIELYSSFRKGARTRSGRLSMHALGRAVDVPPWQTIFNYIHDTFGSRTKELIWGGDPNRNIYYGKHHRFDDDLLRDHGPYQGKPGKFPHVHWSYDEGGWLMPGAARVVNATRKPEPVLNPQQWAAVEDQNDIMRRLVADVNVVGGGRQVNNHYNFRDTTLDPARVQVIRQREEALERADRPY